ncbi:MAG: HAD family phosphatase [Actinomycetia bacterium]|nr:HAD family phosphatase [Actinomycetes bacterium]
MCEIETVVFDMGGVLVELGPFAEVLGDGWQDDAEFWERWLASPLVRDLDAGRIAPLEFCTRLVSDLGLPVAGSDMLERLRQWPKGLLSGAEEMIRSLDGVVQTAILSNTSALHWETQIDSEKIQALFPCRYLSYELGMTKPDAEIFEHVVEDLGVEPGAVLFLDDNQVNVDAACAVGMQAQRCVGVPDATAALATHGVI